MVQSRIYVTHCSAKKDSAFKTQLATPFELYTGQRVQAFMRRCITLKVPWAILSDKYGIVFPKEQLAYYDLHPDQLTRPAIRRLAQNFVEKLGAYREIWFYRNPPRFHRNYQAVLNIAREQFQRQGKSTRILLFSKIEDITPLSLMPYFD
jgi:hypothetical protein